MSLAKKILVDNHKGEIPSNSYNVGYFVASYFKMILDKIGVSPDWPRVETYDDATDEITNQIDITYIVRKLLFLDAAIARLMEQH